MLQTPYSIYDLEVHIIHVCNLFCNNCSHYMNHSHQGTLSLEEAEFWFKTWNCRLKPTKFVLLGGEPTLHPELSEMILLARKMWPSSELHLFTNGYFLKNHPNLEKVLRDTKTLLKISIHGDVFNQLGLMKETPEYNEKFKEIIEITNKWQGVRFMWPKSFEKWYQLYKGYGDSMEPFKDNNPRKSWEICTAKLCHQIHENKIWKCPRIAYLGMQKSKFNLSKDWDDYLKYQALEHTCNHQQLVEFFQREEENICSMCPAYERVIQHSNPVINERKDQHLVNIKFENK